MILAKVCSSGSTKLKDGTTPWTSGPLSVTKLIGKGGINLLAVQFDPVC